MHSPASTTSGSTPSITPTSTPATSNCQHERNDAPDCLPTKEPAMTNDFYLDTFFNPVWMSGPHVFSFAQDGTVVRPETYTPEPYPGYHADRTRRLNSASASHFQGFSRLDPKPWKNVAITEQDDAEFEAFQARMRAGEVGEWRQRPLYAHVQTPMLEEPELVYTWPPRPHGR